MSPVTMLKGDFGRATVVCAVVAHPDDAEIKCFGTLAKYANAGCEVHLIVGSGGEHGVSMQDSINLEDGTLSTSIRMAELYSAFSKINITIHVLGLKDGEQMFNRETILEIEKVMRAIKPNILITHYPNSLGIDHQDHSGIGNSAINIGSRLNLQMILLFEPNLNVGSDFRPNFFVDISDFFELKIEALECHVSQRGRSYLTREFHEIKGRYYAIGAGYNAFDQKAKYESFHMMKFVYQ